MKKKDEEKQKQPYCCAPIISREGKIKRKEPWETPHGEKKKINAGEKTKKQGKAEKAKENLPAPAENKDMTIGEVSFFAEREKGFRQKQKRKTRVHTISQKKKAPFPAMTVVFCGICTLLFMSMVFNFVRINEYTKDISAMQSEVEQLSNQKNQLQTELNNKNSVDKLRQYLESTGNLGMVDEGKMNAPIAVTPQKEDQVEDYDAPEKSETVVSVVLNALAKNFTDVWEAFTGES